MKCTNAHPMIALFVFCASFATAVTIAATAAPPAKATTAPMTMSMPPATAGSTSAIWADIDQKTADLAATIRSGKLADVHHAAFAIRDLAAKLPASLTVLPADKLVKVKSGVKFVATLAKRLDESGDAKDQAATQANFDSLLAVLKTLRANSGTPKP